jgi:hypothetical protein
MTDQDDGPGLGVDHELGLRPRRQREKSAGFHGDDMQTDRHSNVLLTGVGLGQLWARRARTLSDAPAFDFDPSTIPARSSEGADRAWLVAAHALPYRVSLEVVRGGAAFSWIEPAFRAASWFSIESIADVLTIEGSGRLTVGLIPTVRVRGLALGAGPGTATRCSLPA